MALAKQFGLVLLALLVGTGQDIKIKVDGAEKAQKRIVPGVYRGKEPDRGGLLVLTITKSAGPNFNVIGTLVFPKITYKITGSLRPNGEFKGYAKKPKQKEDIFVDGEYYAEGEFAVRVFGERTFLQREVPKTPSGKTKPVKPTPAGPTFGLVEKILGHVPGPADWHEGHIEGGISENMFWTEHKWKPPHPEGRLKVTHHWSHKLTSTLKPGDDLVELTCWSDAEREGPSPPNNGSGAHWWVGGDGAADVKITKTYAGFSSDGKFHARSEAKTTFRVRGGGTIKITAVLGGAQWGSSDNWSPVQYVYKFRERPKAEVGGD